MFYTSGRTSNEAAFLYQLFVRAFGTNNLPDCSNMCHESSGVRAQPRPSASARARSTLEDFDQADLIFVVGQNPGTNHPRMLTALEKAKRGGAQIVAVNPLPEAGLMRFKNPQNAAGMLGSGTALADRLPADPDRRRPGAVPARSNRLLLEAEDAAPGTVLDHAFIAEHTTASRTFAADVRATLDWDDGARPRPA